MKLPTHFILVIFWSVTVLAAFAIGRKLQLAEDNDITTSAINEE